MSERKVLNKYYPPDFDPSKIPRMKLPKNRQYTVRLMAPCNMRCKTCGEYIYKGKKFNARKEDVEGEDYLGIRIYRFYIKCTRCLQEISFKTDPKNTDYEIEAGATRNFMALKLAEEQAQREEDERKEEEASNPMKLLENRTQQSKQELELLESLEELKDLNRRQQSVDYDTMLSQFNDKEALKRLAKKQEEEDEILVKSIFRPKITSKRVIEEEVIEEIGDHNPSSSQTAVGPPLKVAKTATASSDKTSSRASSDTWTKSVGMMKLNNKLGGLVRKKPPITSISSQMSTPRPTTSVTQVSSKLQSSEGKSTQEKKLDASVPQPVNGLSLLGSYSDSDSGSDS